MSKSFCVDWEMLHTALENASSSTLLALFFSHEEATRSFRACPPSRTCIKNKRFYWKVKLHTTKKQCPLTTVVRMELTLSKKTAYSVPQIPPAIVCNHISFS